MGNPLPWNKLWFAIICVFLLNFGIPHTLADVKGSKSASLGTLKLAQVLFRHGDRAPINEYPNDPYGNIDQYWPNGLGQLSKKGMMQQFRLGEYLRYRYNHFIGGTYSKNDIFIQSSYLDRTIMSAEANMAGMYPPDSMDKWHPHLNWQPIPVHTIPTEHDHILDFTIPTCPRFKEEFQNVMQSEYITKIKSENRWVFEYLTEHTGMDVETIQGVADLYDTFFVQTQNGLTLPAFAAEVFPNAMKPLFDLHFKMLSYTEEMLKLRGGPLLKTMVRYMDLHRKIDVSEEDEELFMSGHLRDHLSSEYRKAKMYVYSGHDTTITSLLTTLGVYDNKIPPYAACVMVELHGTAGKPDLDFVKIYYLNDTKEYPYELEVPKCGNPCTLNRLKKLKNHLMINDWEKECQTHSKDDDIPVKEQGIHAEEQIKVDRPLQTVREYFDTFRTKVKTYVLDL